MVTDIKHIQWQSRLGNIYFVPFIMMNMYKCTEQFEAITSAYQTYLNHQTCLQQFCHHHYRQRLLHLFFSPIVS